MKPKAPKVLFVTDEQKTHMTHANMKKPNFEIYLYFLLSTLALSVALKSVWEMSPDDKITTAHGLLLFFLGGVYFTALYRLAQQCITGTDIGVRLLVKKYRFTQEDVLDISNKIVSSMQALFCCITGYVIWGHSCCKDVARANHYVSHAYSWFGAAYFFYDIWSMYKVHVSTPPGQLNTPSAQIHTPAAVRQGDAPLDCGLLRFWRYVKLNPIIVGHHLFIGIFGFSVIIYLKGNLGDCVFGFVFLMEASTPFVSLRGVLSRFHMKKSKLYIYNGFAMLIVFFLCRVAMFPYVMYLYAYSEKISYLDAIYSLPRGCKISIAILMFPQIYWFYLMMKGATKIIINISTPKKTRNDLGGALGGNSIMADLPSASTTTPTNACHDFIGDLPTTPTTAASSSATSTGNKDD